MKATRIGTPPPRWTIRLTCTSVIPLEHTENGHDWYSQPQRDGHLTDPYLPSTIRMATCRTFPPKARHGFPTGPTEPYASLPPESKHDQPPGSKIQTSQPISHPPNTTKSHPTHIQNGSGTLRQPLQLFHGVRHHILYRITLRTPPSAHSMTPSFTDWREHVSQTRNTIQET
jgi:hypothetical protein